MPSMQTRTVVCFLAILGLAPVSLAAPTRSITDVSGKSVKLHPTATKAGPRATSFGIPEIKTPTVLLPGRISAAEKILQRPMLTRSIPSNLVPSARYSRRLPQRQGLGGPSSFDARRLVRR
jgi:hypothetical protein